MKKLIESIKYWGQLLLLPIYWFSFLIPRDKHIWLFGSTFGRRFADNPRYFYLYLAQHGQLGIRPIWISHNKQIVEELTQVGYEAYWNLSLKGIYYCLIGKVYLFDNYSKDICFPLSGGAVKINLWHGIPLKKIQMDNQYDKIRHPDTCKEKLQTIPRRISDEKPSHYIVAPSPAFAPIFSSAFRTKRVIVCGYPRWDSFEMKPFFLLETEKKEAQALSSKKYQKLICYLPTFRETETKFFQIVDLVQLNTFLKENDYLLCIKLHCKSKLQKEFRKIQSKHIFLMDSYSDSYAFLKYADVLITDYSSVYFDYLFTEKPIIFFCYDLEEYVKQSREFYFPYFKMTPGRKAATWEELKEAIKNCEVWDEEVQTVRMTIQKKIFAEKEAEGFSYQLFQKIELILNRNKKLKINVKDKRKDL